MNGKGNEEHCRKAHPLPVNHDSELRDIGLSLVLVGAVFRLGYPTAFVSPGSPEQTSRCVCSPLFLIPA